MATPVERVREVTASQSDDYFEDDTILHYVNKAKENVISFLIAREVNGNKSLRGLDKLRTSQETSVNGLTFTVENDYYKVSVDTPSNMRQFSYLTFTALPMKELSQNNLIKLNHGNAIPTLQESYYSVKSTEFELYLPENYSTTNHKVKVYYIKNTTDLTLSDSFTEIPKQLENAVIYNAAFMLVTQESIKDQTTQADRFKSQYKEELQTNIY